MTIGVGAASNVTPQVVAHSGDITLRVGDLGEIAPLVIAVAGDGFGGIAISQALFTNALAVWVVAVLGGALFGGAGRFDQFGKVTLGVMLAPGDVAVLVTLFDYTGVLQVVAITDAAAIGIGPF